MEKSKVNQWILIGIIIIIGGFITGGQIDNPFDFSLILTRGSANVTQGNGVNTNVIISLLNGTTQNVDLSQAGCPTDATCTFTPSSGNPTFNSTLLVSTSPTTPTGTYNIVVTGTGGGVSHSITFILTVNAPAPFDFFISSPLRGSVEQGSIITPTITVYLLSGATESVSLSSLGCPPSSDCTFTPSSGNPTYGSIFKVKTDISTPTGTYPITIIGTSARGVAKNNTYTLTVNKPAVVYYSDNFESGFNWGVSGLWHLTTRRSNSPTHSLWYGNESTGTYQTGSSRNSGSAISPLINLSDASNPKLTFNSYWNTESGSYYDTKKVFVSNNNGITWTQVLQVTANPRVWITQTVSLTSYVGQAIKIKFAFDTIDGYYNNYEGWFIDDVKLTG